LFHNLVSSWVGTIPRLGKKGLVKCRMSANEVWNAPTYYTTLAPNNALPDPNFCSQTCF